MKYVSHTVSFDVDISMRIFVTFCIIKRRTTNTSWFKIPNHIHLTTCAFNRFYYLVYLVYNHLEIMCFDSDDSYIRYRMNIHEKFPTKLIDGLVYYIIISCFMWSKYCSTKNIKSHKKIPYS